METIFDWVAIGLFAALIVLFLQRSTQESGVRDNIWQYLGASVGCAAFNYLGNQGYAILAVLVIVADLAFVWFVLKPFEGQGWR